MSTRHPMPFGETPTHEGGRLFALWAPAAQEVALMHGGATTEGELPHRVLARRDADGWWRAQLPECPPGTRYQWCIDGTLRAPDPASRYNPRGPHHPSEVIAPEAFPWRTQWPGRPWHELVFYELHVGSFTTDGTYAAAQEHLPRLAELGFTAIELMPLATFVGEWGWGYDGVLPYAPHPAYGSPDDLKRFIDAAHALGLCVFIDVVYNHFGPDGNYLHAYAPHFFSQDHQSPWGAALNFDRPGSETVRDFFIHNALYWLQEFRADGLRLDAVHAIADESSPDILEELSARVRELAPTCGRPLHLVLENEHNEARRLATTAVPGLYDGQWNDDFHHSIHVALTQETQGYYAKFGEDPIALLGRVFTHGFSFEHGQLSSAAPAPLGALVQFMGNHDQIGNRAFGERLASLAPSPDAVELALLLSLLTPALPMVFMGDEFGASTPFLYFANWEGDLRQAVREGRQREFSHEVPPGRKLPDPCDISSLHASQLRWDEAASPAGQARSDLVRRALQARREWLVPLAQQLQSAGHTAERTGPQALRVQWRYAGDTRLQLEVNLGSTAIEVAATGVPMEHASQAIFSYHRGSSDESLWPAWSARWTLLNPP